MAPKKSFWGGIKYLAFALGELNLDDTMLNLGKRFFFRNYLAVFRRLYIEPPHTSTN